MVVTNTDEVQVTLETNYDRASELKAFDETKAGVEGLVDAGIDKIPRMFYQPPDNVNKALVSSDTQFSFPVIDLEGVCKDPIQREEIVERVRDASEKWGFFQLINRGIPMCVLEEMKAGVIRFYEQDDDIKKEYYTRDFAKKVVYNTNFDLYRAPAANWRDSMYSFIAPNPPDPQDMPAAFRDIMMEYSKHVMELGYLLLELLSEALGLNPSYLKEIGCA